MIEDDTQDGKSSGENAGQANDVLVGHFWEKPKASALHSTTSLSRSSAHERGKLYVKFSVVFQRLDSVAPSKALAVDEHIGDSGHARNATQRQLSFTASASCVEFVGNISNTIRSQGSLQL